ncbi:MAG: protein translocase subunit SecF [Anaerolineae bacterium]|nr:protein translocase subunit SecF [Anaerolineae bacterium]
MIDFVRNRRTYFILAGALVVLSVIGMLASYAVYGQLLRVGIDFKGGSLFSIRFTTDVSEETIREAFAAEGYSGTIVQQLGDPTDYSWQIRTSFATTDQVNAVLARLDESTVAVDRGNSVVDTVEASVGAEVARSAAQAVGVAALVVLAFIWFSFRRIPNPLRYGVASVVAMLINVIVAMGFYALMGFLQGWEADALFLTAILTVIGFSVQDIIVVFDRIRENIPRHRGEPFSLIVNRSIMETLHRSLATQLNAMFVMIAILLFGGDTLKPFIAVMLVGMLSETFTSMFVAVHIVGLWEERGRLRPARAS